MNTRKMPLLLTDGALLPLLCRKSNLVDDRNSPIQNLQNLS